MACDCIAVVDEKLAELAAGLTRAQKKWLPSFTGEWVTMYPIGISRRTMQGFVDWGLLEREFPKGFGMIKWRLTPLGISVRDHLLSTRPSGGGE